ncbi:MAG: ABC transporter ATP-binding protein [Herpetosiphonaceae bacterium]|nr:ABC transporter ATP-binding protein [Herpetosiphonaceae bacterium]
MIEATDLHKFFGDFHAVRGVSLHVAAGEVLALLGPNGAGKTTTVRMLSAILQPSRGSARVAGFDVMAEPQQVRAHIGLLTEYPGLYARMNGLDYLLFFAKLLQMQPVAARRRAEQLLKQFGLWEARERKIDGYSKGMKQKMALIRAMLHDPPVLFLDEPTTAMDPQSARTVRDAINELRSTSRAIVLCTHNLAEAEVLADRIAVVRGGQIVAQGSEAQLTAQLLGDPLWELRMVGSDTDAAQLLAEVVTVEQVDGALLRYRTADADAVNPLILQRLHSVGLPVIALSAVPQSLEAVYLRIVDTSEPERMPQA